MTGEVAADGSIAFVFTELSLADIERTAGGKYPPALIRWCFDENHQ